MKLRNVIIGCVVAAALASCSSTKTTLPYFQDITTVEEGTLRDLAYMPTVQPDDELFITVQSTDPVATAQYNLPSVNPSPRENMLEVTTTARQKVYIVDSKGNIDFPHLGTLHVAGMTPEQVADDITARISAEVADPMVTVSIVNFKVNVMGEVKTPNQLKINSNRVTILDALALAGDLTEYGDRSNVLVIREDNGKRTYAHLDLNSSDVLNSPYYYLRQNDIVYVQPNSIREANSKYNTNNSYKLSLTSTIVSAASVIASLIIALTVK